MKWWAWQGIMIRLCMIMICGMAMLLQSSLWALEFNNIKINYLYTFLILVILVGMPYFGLSLALGVGFSYDLLSSNAMGFYMASYFFPLLVVVFLVDKLRNNLTLPLFGLTVFILVALKMGFEVVFLSFIYGLYFGLMYLQSIGLLEVVVTTIFSIFPYGLYRYVLYRWLPERRERDELIYSFASKRAS